MRTQGCLITWVSKDGRRSRKGGVGVLQTNSFFHKLKKLGQPLNQAPESYTCSMNHDVYAMYRGLCNDLLWSLVTCKLERPNQRSTFLGKDANGLRVACDIERTALSLREELALRM